MIRTTSTFRVPILRLVGTFLTLAALAGLPTGAWAEFRIGVWQPGGHVGGQPEGHVGVPFDVDTSFTAATVADLDALGVDLLLNTPDGVGNQPTQPDYGGYQDFEENILSLWNNTVPGPNGPRGFVIQHAPEGHSRLTTAAGHHWKLERYAGSLWANCRQGEFAGDSTNTDLTSGQRINLGETVDSLSTKWTTYDGFYGYRIGHEADPCGGDGGIYNSDTYENMVTVIDSIRAYDTEHRIIAVGNTMNTREWTAEEQTAFRQSFFRLATEPGPANIFMQEVYILARGDTTEESVQARFNVLRDGLDSIGTMVDSALSENRRAEWHFIAQVSRTDRVNPAQDELYRHPTLPELKAQVNMALSRGATGVTYFLYTSSNGPVSNYEYTGLVDLNRRPVQPIWNTVQTVNNTLRTLGDALYPLTWDAGFGSDGLSALTLVDAVQLSAAPEVAADRLEFGVFHDDEADYVLVVNRHNLTSSGSQTIDLRLDTQRMQSDHANNGFYSVAEIVADVEHIHVADDSGHLWITQQTFAPGDARLYRIEQVEVPGAPHVMALPGDSQVMLEWEAAAEHGSPITRYEVRWREAAPGHDWPRWSPVAGGGTARDTTVTGLLNGTRYELAVRAVNGVGEGAAASRLATPQAALTSVSFGSATYQAFEGGEPVSVVVRLSPLPSQPLRIPVQVSADPGTEADDYTVAGLTGGAVWFAAGVSEQSFSITANEDDDSDDETVSLSFETLGTVVRATPEATVTLRDNDAADGTIALSSLSPQEGTQLTAELTDPSGGITNPRWQWQRRSSPTAKWINAAGVSSQPLPWVSIYLPQAGDVGDQLRATVGYTDANGPNQRAESAATAAVRSSPTPLVNRPPSVPSGPDEVSVAENTTAIGTYTSTDPDGNALGWTVSPSATFSINGGTLRFKSAPDYESGITVYTATLKTYDGALWSPAKTVRVQVPDVNERPSAPSGPGVVSVVENTTAIGSYASTDPDGDTLGWTVSPSGTFSISGGALRFKHAPDYESGITVYTATLKTYDGALWSPTKTVRVQVTDVDDDITPLAVRDLASRSTGLTSGQASWNPPSNALEAKVHSYRYRLDGGTIQPTTSTSASFSSLQSGRRYSVDVWAVGSSGAGPITTTTFITESGVAPVLDAVGPLTCYVGEYCSFTFPTASKGTAPITYKVSPPSWAKASGRSFSGTAPSSPGTASASLNASNSYGTDSESLTINIKRRPVAGVAPVLPSVSSITCYVGEYCSFTFPAASKGTSPITYKVSAPSWAKASGRSFSGTAPSSPGTASASLNASNAYGTDSESLTINVKKRPVAGVAPVLASVSSITCYVGEYCSFTFPAATSGTKPITYKVSAPSWAKASGSRGFAGTAPSSPGTDSASLNASNAYGTDSESLTINVKKRGYPPVLASVSSITCYVGEYCSFTFPAATSGTKPITYKVSPPSWARASGSRGFAGAAPSSPGTFSASLNASNAYGTDSESLTIHVKRRLAMAPRHSPEFGHVIGGRPIWDSMDGTRYGWRYRLLLATN